MKKSVLRDKDRGIVQMSISAASTRYWLYTLRDYEYKANAPYPAFASTYCT